MIVEITPNKEYEYLDPATRKVVRIRIMRNHTLMKPPWLYQNNYREGDSLFGQVVAGWKNIKYKEKFPITHS